MPFCISRLFALSLSILLGVTACAEKTATPAEDAVSSEDASDATQTGDTAADTAGGDTAGLPLLATATGDTNFAVAAAGWYRGDLHFHTNFSEDAKKQGGDNLTEALVIADAWRDPVYTNANPGTAGNGLDFVAVTDHRTDLAQNDPAFHHDHLILLPGEEFGGSGHAGIWGNQKHITGDPIAGESANTRIQNAIDEAHAVGALFSPNHPTQDNNWVWDVKGYDAIEIWNGPWSAFYGPTNEADVDSRAKSIGAEGPYVRQAAIRGGGGGSNAQAMIFWRYHLSDGRHPAVVGGGDRHMLLPAGLPTTYVHKSRKPEFDGKVGQAVGVQGILGGIAARETFVSRSPLGAQVDLAAEGTDGVLHPMGAQLAPGQTYTIRMTVSRAVGGRIRLYSAPLGKAVDGKWPDAQMVYEAGIEAPRASGTWQWQVPAGGAWLHAVVLEPLIVQPLPETLDQVVALLSKLPAGKDLGGMVQVFANLLGPNDTITDATACDPSKWDPWLGQCMPADKDTWATYYIPDPVVRLMSTWFEDGQPTAFCAGAVSSAFLAK